MSRRSRATAYSIIDPIQVLRLVRRRWGWTGATCELWSRSVSDCYRIEHRGERAYLKIYRHGWRSRAEVLGEIELLRFLEHRGVRVARPIADASGSFVATLDAAEGRRCVAMFGEAEGVMPESSRENSRKYGRLAATLHDATDHLPVTIRRPRVGIDHLAREPLESIHSWLSRRPRESAFLGRLATELAAAVTSLLPEAAPAFGLCHGDLTFGNVRRDGHGRLTLFDFDLSGYSWRAYDVAVFLQSREYGFTRRAVASRTRQWDAFLDGYSAVRRLTNAELHAVVLFVPLRQIWQLGMHTNSLANIGSHALHQAAFERRLEFIRGWLKVYKPL